VGAVDQHVHAVSADGSHDHCAKESHIKSGVLKGIRHCQNARTNVALQQMNQGIEVGRRMLQVAMMGGVIGLIRRSNFIISRSRGCCVHSQKKAKKL